MYLDQTQVCGNHPEDATGQRKQARLAGSVPYHLGYGLTHPIALEGALKLKEITYAHCEGIFSSELKHGPLSAVHDGYPVIFITAPATKQRRGRINHVKVTTRGGCAIAIAAKGPALRANVHDYLVIPEVNRWRSVSPILLALPACLISCHITAEPGTADQSGLARRTQFEHDVDKAHASQCHHRLCRDLAG